MKAKIVLPSKVRFIIKELNRNGFEAFAVGGCIRDSILKRNINDWDITTDAKPENVMGIFRRTIKTGIKHGTVTVMLDNEAFEVTTYRIDGKYKDNRHPSNVFFVSNIEEDLARRDFTINSLAYNDKDGIVDCFCGLKDIENKTIRAVGNAENRFEEDALRIMRGIRFASSLNFNIEYETERAMIKLSPLIKNISIERIVVEFNKILLSNGEYINNLNDYGILKVFLPEVSNYEKEEFNKALLNLNKVENKLYLKLFLLLKEIKRAEKVHEILKRLKYENKIINNVIALINYYEYPISNKGDIKRLLNKIGVDLYVDILSIKKLENINQNEVDKQRILFEEVIINQECFLIKDLKINGNDLKTLGILEGSQIGEILSKLLYKVINDPNLNHKDKLLNLIRK